MDPVLHEPIQNAKANRWDLFVFVAAFGAGLLAYLFLRVALYSAGVRTNLVQLIVTGAIVGVMVIYAVVVSRIPRLRVRLDQAGDNAYYLGLLFTLTSMAVALWEFGSIVAGSESGAAQESGARQIISNFGIALASTIAGIFLRVILHQMRVDPADVESMTRIELSEASKRVRASLDSVSSDMARFHDEIRQRAADAIVSMTGETQKAVQSLMVSVQEASTHMLDATQAAQGQVLNQTRQLLETLTETAEEAAAAVDRLRGVEPPPVLLAKRLGKLTGLLEAMGEQASVLTDKLNATVGSADSVVERFRDSSIRLETLAGELGASQARNVSLIEHTVEQVSATLSRVGEEIKEEGQLLAELREKARKSVVDASLAQKGAVESLLRLSQLSDELVRIMKLSRAGQNVSAD